MPPGSVTGIHGKPIKKQTHGKNSVYQQWQHEIDPNLSILLTNIHITYKNQDTVCENGKLENYDSTYPTQWKINRNSFFTLKSNLITKIVYEFIFHTDSIRFTTLSRNKVLCPTTKQSISIIPVCEYLSSTLFLLSPTTNHAAA